MKKNSTEAYNLPAIMAQFKTAGQIEKVQPHGAGYIHDTFYLANNRKECLDYLLQRINHSIFKNVPLLMANIYQVTAHLSEKLPKRSAYFGAHSTRPMVLPRRELPATAFAKSKW